MENAPEPFLAEALARLFEHDLAAGEAVSFSLPGGATLFAAGEPADQIFLLRAGRLAALAPANGRERRLLGLIRPGEPVGEMAVIAGEAHSADVVALRDCELQALPAARLILAATRDPVLMAALARLMLRRARPGHAASPTRLAVFGFLGLGPALDVRALAESIGGEIRALGYRVTVAGAEIASESSHWFSNLELDCDFILYAAEAGDGGWIPLMRRQIDRLFIVGAGDRPPMTDRPVNAAGEAIAVHPRDLILIQPDDIAIPKGSADWTRAIVPEHVFQVRRRRAADLQRLARIITGQAVGLVLSGGAARAYAHIGAIRALHAREVPIDLLAGVSMGAIIAAGLAMGWDDAELDHRIRKAFVQSSPLDDVAFPLLAMTRGIRVRDRLAEHFGDQQICDLWLPFFCISSNLTTGEVEMHKRGLLRDALAASGALPGVLPPWIEGTDVLVDGAVLNNLPADLMRETHAGPIIGVDVSRGRSITAKDAMHLPLGRWLLTGAWRRGPPIVSLRMRSATLSSAHDLLEARKATDLLIQPNLDRIEIRDWKAYDAAVAAGENATRTVLDSLTVPVTELRLHQGRSKPQTSTTGPTAESH